MRRRVSLAVLLVLALAGLGAAAAPAEEKPVTVAYYYRVRWGFQQEFERLFFKNHYPVLKDQMGPGGRIRAVSVYRPTFHGEGRADWTFLVVITFASWNALGGPSPDEAIAKRLYPDQDAFKREEQRRFEILDAHWDVPLSEVEPPR
ncbi:MAG: hypothetical protein ACM3PV_15670 [Betaproteobacteria bacterium]